MTVLINDADFTLHVGDALEVLRTLPNESVDCVVTSPPYWGLRDYSVEGQLGLEPTPAEYVATMTALFREVRRVLKPSGTVWLNLGDSYAAQGGNANAQTMNGMKDTHREAIGGRTPPPGLKPKDLVGIPWRVAFALQEDGWYLRSDIIWAKPNPMPESVTDRPTKAHEYVFLLSKRPRYFFDAEAVRESDSGRPSGNGFVRDHRLTYQNPDGTGRGNEEQWEPGGGRNVRSVWEIATQPFPEAHFATFPVELARRCILAGCPEGGVVLDPFMGSGTVALTARQHGRRSIGVELSPEYAEMCARRLGQLSLLATP